MDSLTDPPSRIKTSAIVHNALMRFRKTLLAVGQDEETLREAASKAPRWHGGNGSSKRLSDAFAYIDSITNQPGKFSVPCTQINAIMLHWMSDLYLC